MRDPFDSAPALRLGDAPAKRLIAESRAARETGIIPNAEIVAVEAPKTDTAIPRPPSLDPVFGDAFGEALSKPKAYSFKDVDFSVCGVDLGTGPDETGVAIYSRDGLVDWIDKHGVYDAARENLALEIERMSKKIAESYAIPVGLLYGRNERPMTATQKAELERYFARFATLEQFRGASADDVTITGVVRKRVGDGATRYEPAPLLRSVEPRILSEAEFAEWSRRSVPIYLTTPAAEEEAFVRKMREVVISSPKVIDHGDTSAASLVANHEIVVGKATLKASVSPEIVAEIDALVAKKDDPK